MGEKTETTNGDFGEVTVTREVEPKAEKQLSVEDLLKAGKEYTKERNAKMDEIRRNMDELKELLGRFEGYAPKSNERQLEEKIAESETRISKDKVIADAMEKEKSAYELANSGIFMSFLKVFGYKTPKMTEKDAIERVLRKTINELESEEEVTSRYRERLKAGLESERDTYSQMRGQRNKLLDTYEKHEKELKTKEEELTGFIKIRDEYIKEKGKGKDVEALLQAVMGSIDQTTNEILEIKEYQEFTTNELEGVQRKLDNQKSKVDNVNAHYSLANDSYRAIKMVKEDLVDSRDSRRKEQSYFSLYRTVTKGKDLLTMAVKFVDQTNAARDFVFKNASQQKVELAAKNQSGPMKDYLEGRTRSQQDLIARAKAERYSLA